MDRRKMDMTECSSEDLKDFTKINLEFTWILIIFVFTFTKV
jgi:hypothetical protein